MDDLKRKQRMEALSDKKWPQPPPAGAFRICKPHLDYLTLLVRILQFPRRDGRISRGPSQN